MSTKPAAIAGDVEVLTMPKPGRRRTYTLDEKRRAVEESHAVGVSAVARRYAISPSQIFRWRKLMDQGALQSLRSDEAVVPESEAKQLRAQIRELQRLLGRKTMEVEILKEGLEIAREKKLLSRSKLPGGGGGQ